MKTGTRERMARRPHGPSLEREKELTRASDALARARAGACRGWQVTEPYVFDTTDGERTFPELFGRAPGSCSSTT